MLQVRNESFKAVIFVARQPCLGVHLVATLVLAAPKSGSTKKENDKKSYHTKTTRS